MVLVRLVIVRFRLGTVSSSDSSSSEDDEDDEESGTIDLRVMACGRVRSCGVDLVGVKARVVRVSVEDGGRKEGTGEFAVLLRAWASRKAATDIRCDESDAALSPRGRGRAGGGSSEKSEGGRSD